MTNRPIREVTKDLVDTLDRAIELTEELEDTALDILDAIALINRNVAPTEAPAAESNAEENVEEKTEENVEEKTEENVEEKTEEAEEPEDEKFDREGAIEELKKYGYTPPKFTRNSTLVKKLKELRDAVVHAQEVKDVVNTEPVHAPEVKDVLSTSVVTYTPTATVALATDPVDPIDPVVPVTDQGVVANDQVAEVVATPEKVATVDDPFETIVEAASDPFAEPLPEKKRFATYDEFQTAMFLLPVEKVNPMRKKLITLLGQWDAKTARDLPPESWATVYEELAKVAYKGVNANA